MLELIIGLENHREFMRFNLNRHEDPNMLFLLETKLPSKKLDVIKLRLGMYAFIGVNSEGQAGGQAPMWKDMMDIQLRSFSS